MVHGIPSDEDVLREGDIISIDVGATVDGWAGDNAWTFAVGEVDPRVQALLEATEESLWAGIAEAKAGHHMGDIGYMVNKTARKAGFKVVREFLGHGIGHDMHEEPNVPNFGHKHRGILLEPGMVLAIEPIVAFGSPKLTVGETNWDVFLRDGKPSAHFERTVAITPDGPELISVEPDRVRPL